MEAFFFGNLIHIAEIIPKVWICISCEQSLYHTVTKQKERKVEVVDEELKPFGDWEVLRKPSSNILGMLTFQGS